MKLRATLCGVLVIASCVGAGTRDSAVIVNSGSTNTAGYRIALSSDGSASVTTQNRDGAPAGKTKSFSVPASTVARFFSDLATARKEKAPLVPCMKSASFGTSTHVTWQGWVSPDLDCPPATPAVQALVKDLGAIRQAAGVSVAPLRRTLTPPETP